MTTPLYTSLDLDSSAKNVRLWRRWWRRWWWVSSISFYPPASWILPPLILPLQLRSLWANLRRRRTLLSPGPWRYWKPQRANPCSRRYGGCRRPNTRNQRCWGNGRGDKWGRWWCKSASTREEECGSWVEGEKNTRAWKVDDAVHDEVWEGEGVGDESVTN